MLYWICPHRHMHLSLSYVALVLTFMSCVSLLWYAYALIHWCMCPYTNCVCSYASTHCSFRGWPKHIQTNESDTSDTDDDELVGGMGKYSHGPYSLTHHHWVEQVIAAGSFGVHCTEAAEAHHKISMRLAANRVRHLRQNQTQGSMLSYLRRHVLFSTLLQDQSCPTPAPSKSCTPTCGIVQLPLVTTACPRAGRKPCTMGFNLHEVRNQQRFIHPEVRLARVELMDLLCDRLGLPKSRATYRRMNQLEWKLGQKLIMPHGTYWATDTRYTCSTSENASRRRNKFLLRGTESVSVTKPNGDVVDSPTALCCEAVCFLQIGNVNELYNVVNRKFSVATAHTSKYARIQSWLGTHST